MRKRLVSSYLQSLLVSALAALTLLEAADGRQALEAIKADPPHLILSDWNMPDMTGIELLEELRKQGSTIKFGFVTSEGSTEMRRRAMDAGAIFLITKPFTADTFQQTLSSIIK